MTAAPDIGRVGFLAATLGAGVTIVLAGTGEANADSRRIPTENTGAAASSDRGRYVTGRAARTAISPARGVRPPGSASAISPAQRFKAQRSPVADRTSRSRDISSPAHRRAAGPTVHPFAATISSSSTDVQEAVVGESAAAQSQATAQSVDPITTLFNNSTPRVHAFQTTQTPGGVVSGTLDIVDPDSTSVGIAVSGRPTHGTVTMTGKQFVYTANPAAPDAHIGFTDTFTVTANDESSGFHLHGLSGLINLLTFGLIGTSGHTSSTRVTVTVAPFNNAPTGTISAGGPDPVTGVVTGRVIGSDPNGDSLIYRGSSLTTHGAVSVSATGEFTYTPTPEALAEHTGEQDGFAVGIDDGYGGTATVEVVVPVGRAAPAGELSTFCGCTLMPADTVFHADISTLPVLPQSETWTTLLGGTLHPGFGGSLWMGSTGGMPVNVVSADHPVETVIFNRGYSTSGPSIDDRPYAIPDRPLVEGMPDVPAWDRHLLVFQKGTCISQELYNVANGVELPAAGVLDGLGNAAYAALWGSSWIAEAGVHVDMSSGLYPETGWANASRLPYLPMIVRPDDLERGWIDHMLGMSIAKDRGTGYTWPARSGDGTGTNPDGVPMGTVFRLRADFPVTDYAPATQVVLRALQQHGAVVYDSFGAGRDGAGLLGMSNGWTGTDHLIARAELNTVPLSAFEAVDVLSLATDPAAGWMIRA